MGPGGDSTAPPPVVEVLSPAGVVPKDSLPPTSPSLQLAPRAMPSGEGLMSHQSPAWRAMPMPVSSCCNCSVVHGPWSSLGAERYAGMLGTTDAEQ